MKLKTLLKALSTHDDYLQNEDPEILELEIDSRLVTKGTLFFCIKGYQTDGHNYAKQAVENGAAAIIAEDDLDVEVPVVYVNDAHLALAMISDYFYGQPSRSMNVMGVTGTNGKTTVTHLIRSIQEEANVSTGLIGTMGMKYKDQFIPVNNTTPESYLVQRYLKKMKDEEIQSVVMEVSSHALYQGRVRGCDFDIGIFTNLTQDHLDFHKTMKDYLYAKSLLFSQLGNTYDLKHPKAAVLNIDDPATKIYRHMTAAPVWTYGIVNHADFRAEDIKITANGTEFRLVTKTGCYPVSMNLIGKFSVYNVLASLLACYLKGIKIDQMIKTIEKVKGVPGRFETVNAGQPFTVIVDYSHTADSLENALETIKEFANGKIITVIGCGGDRDKTKRPIMAKTAVDRSDLVILTSDNPRTEDPEKILEDMEAGVVNRDYIKELDRRKAIKLAVQKADKSDIILIAGKGHETYQIIGTTKFDFDDRLVAKEAIKERYNR
ncbi:UDP-N-acetylmuramoyl-L-alanyl-D-glutamate--2,6-diaminopimelate ligase [Terrilactibacillus sp. BCM23-1]|uniref:UDP-N-acetylmuramoyl-L-alanyl-D-glutamate--2,6-diaminopimelate ligase n=1 Tax=Terrilactibacillus tamarindi TaxID=2599694 RepID=A0A6N8CSH7_9BACI|nr:UDP-N-acetylmuramoyl-L-alanyl-D-glutamate--2,6-diaminopimelate ligase [Terrilactibacillus tamarindi]MTT32013.1 UDP-N-acetylmuramoyl-L-alanyl-D-glutamate--2,6-diaminopimelate ligase [Terrilactibacillus tamarindi]